MEGCRYQNLGCLQASKLQYSQESLRMDKQAILLVDDEAIILMSLVQELRVALGSAYRYETARSMQEARELMDELSADGIPLVACVSDWLMPGGRGDELLAEVRSLFPEAVLIVVTGYADDEDIERACRKLGIAARIQKPWGRMQIARVLREALSPG
jgi:response regulator RpfG family c-di-GMP phosphodiesterase